MATAKRPPMLGSKIARRTLEGRNRIEFFRLFDVLDTVERQYNALETLYHTDDPNRTKEGRAARYGEQYRKAHDLLGKLSVEVATSLENLERKLLSDAEHQAGLNKPMTEGAQQEIRAALRAMPQSKRDATLRDAALNGDVGILKAVRESPTEFLYGGTTEPIESLVQQHIERAVPELRDELQAIEHAYSHLKLSVDGFVREADKMRDPVAEQRAQEQAEQIRQAEAALAAGDAGGGDDAA